MGDTCSKCGRPWSYPPCGPTHAAISMEGGSVPDVEFPPSPPCLECGQPLTSRNRVDVKEFEGLCYDCYKLKPKHICVDFDGVLADYTGWKGPDHLGAIKPWAREFLAVLNKDFGMKVIILTTRDPEKVYAWLIDNKLHDLVDRVTREKPPAVAYLDDRAICFHGSFEHALEEIKNFKPYWKEG